MRVIVTRVSGPRGVLLCERLAAKGHEAYLHLSHTSELSESFAIQSPDAVIHLAGGENSPDWIRTSADNGYRLNINDTLNVLEACRINEVPTVLVETSSRVYGDQGASASGIKTRETAPLLATDPYSVSKICADYLTRSYADNYGLNAVAVRNAPVYGTRDPHRLYPDDHIITDTILSILRGDEPIIRSSGWVRRSYLFDEDYADAYATILNNAESLKGLAVNVSTPERIPVKELVATICEVMCVEERYILMNGLVLPSENLDFSLLSSLGWEPLNSLRQGIKKVVDEFASREQSVPNPVSA